MQQAEHQLLGALSHQPEDQYLLAGLAYCYIQDQRHLAASTLLKQLQHLYSDSIVTRSLAAQLKTSFAIFLDPSEEPIDPEDSWSLLLAIASAHIALDLQDFNRFTRLNAALDSLGLDCPEMAVIRARNARLCGDLDKAFLFLVPVLERAPMLLEPYVLILNIAMQGEMSDRVMPVLRFALDRYGEHPALLGFVTTANLLKRQPGLARRSSLLQRCWGTVQNWENHLDNHLSSYEGMGLTPWIEHIHYSLRCQSDLPLQASQLNLQSNLALQLASLGSKHSQSHLQAFLPSLKAGVEQRQLMESRIPLASPPKRGNRLRIGWLTSDFGHHPVGRFLLSFLEAASGHLKHDHVVISHRDRSCDHFDEQLQAVENVAFVDVSGYKGPNRVAAIRRVRADLILDLNGWTAGHVIPDLIARLAPVQVNYLGYFASTGLSEIDYWLGDQNLFPPHMQEWHSETIARLPRCFIAWQPSHHLPEAHASITKPPSGPIRFGTFNHSRKFSDHTLRLWGRILRQLPDAQLVLKAHAHGDPATQTLLLRRMHRAGLPTDRILWLPLTGTTEEHLQQYNQIDVALDCTPNGGCTTTCEALWMGVPVITLAGNCYVSRMSTAVLHGAGLSDWVATTDQAYVDLAEKQADRLKLLRAQRSQWRQQLIQSPLGDAAGLMHSLEEIFESMVFKTL